MNFLTNLQNYLINFQASDSVILKETGSDWGEIFKTSLGLNIPIIIAHIIAMITMVFLLSRFVYKPFKKWNKSRLQNLININKEADKKLINADKLKLEAQNTLKQSKQDGEEYLTILKSNLQTEEQQMLQDIVKRRKKLINETEMQIKQMKNDVQKETQDALINNALLLTEKILEQKINFKKHQEVIDDFIKQLNE